MRRLLMVCLAAVGALAAPLAAPLGAQAAPAAQPARSLESVAFLTGCWRGVTRSGIVIEEIYTAPSANLVQGLSRYLRDGRTVDFEFTTITADSGGPTLRPQPRGGEPVAFPLKELTARDATWENLTHDYPQRVKYSRVHADTLVARIEGPAADGSLRSSEWRMTKVECFKMM